MSLRIYGNRLLKTLPGKNTRPTSGRVREAVFNIWQGKIDQCRWLDLCAGSGSMGAEALCRGAKLVVGIEKSSHACAIIQENWQHLITEQQVFHILRGDVVQQLKKLSGQTFDRIYFDPPYTSDLYDQVLNAIAGFKLLHKHGEIAVEHSSDFKVPIIPVWQVIRQRNYGNTSLTFYSCREECESDGALYYDISPSLGTHN
jgi:16S rRNA (guanine(966)-N(2))-methyltransferase RsmD